MSISIRFATRRFAPTVFGTVLTIAGVALFMQLGFWQLQRAEEKQALLGQYASGAQSIIDLTASNADSLPLYQRVRMRGRYDPGRQILLDNMPSPRGQPGYRIVTPFELEQGGWLLVDRGWVPLGTTRSAIPDITVDAMARTVSGRLDALPRAGIELTAPVAPPDSPWPRVMSYPTLSAVEGVLARKLIPGLVLLDADQPDGYERATQLHTRFDPKRHIAYAVQWFALALTALMTYLILSLRRERADERPSL